MSQHPYTQAVCVRTGSAHAHGQRERTRPARMHTASAHAHSQARALQDRRCAPQMKAQLRSAKQGYVRALPGVEYLWEEVSTASRFKRLVNLEDLTIQLRGDIGDANMIQMVRCLLTADGTLFRQPMYSFSTLVELRVTHQQAIRHETLREESLAYLFVKRLKKVNNLPALVDVTDGGKTNKNNNVQYSMVLPHRNALLCTIFARALLLLYRFKTMKEFAAEMDKQELLNISTFHR